MASRQIQWQSKRTTASQSIQYSSGHALSFSDEALEAGAKVAVCSTSNEKAVQKIVDVMMDPKVGSQIQVFAGDVVANKKPDPAIYFLAARELGVEPSRYTAYATCQPADLSLWKLLAVSCQQPLKLVGARDQHCTDTRGYCSKACDNAHQ